MKLFTIGHSSRAIETFNALLKNYGIETLVDVRAFPSSSKFPHFNKENLKASLFQIDIEYHWLGKELGGYRKKSEGLGERSPNKGLDAGGYRIYADHMLTDGFKNGTEKLRELAEQRTTVYMCAEKFFWRCHRMLISDYLVSRGHEIWHIIQADQLRIHELSKIALPKDGVLTYPAQNFFDPPLLPWENEESISKKGEPR